MRRKEEKRSLCTYCGTGCGIIIDVIDGYVEGVKGDTKNPSGAGMLCTKGEHLHHTVYAPGRLTKGRCRKGLDEPFRGCTMDEAIGEAAEGLKRIIEEHGPEAVAFFLPGDLTTEEYYTYNKLAKGYIGTPNVDTTASLVHSSGLRALTAAFGSEAVPCSYEDIYDAECIFIFGSPPRSVHPVTYRRVELAKEANPDLKVVVVDPRTTEICKIADLHLKVMPGTDLLLLKSMLNLLVWDDHLESDFIENHTKGSEETFESVREVTPGSVAHETGLDPADISRAAYWFGSLKTLSLWTMGYSASRESSEKATALINLHLATGNICKAGTGFFNLAAQSGAMGGRETGCTPKGLPSLRNLTNPEDRDDCEEVWPGSSIPTGGGLQGRHIIDSLESGEIKALYLSGANPLKIFPQQERTAEALRALDLLIVADTTIEEDMEDLAHIILPAAGWAEREGTYVSAERGVTHAEEAVPPRGEAMAEWRIAGKLAVAINPEWEGAFSHTSPEEIFEEYKPFTRGRCNDITALTYDILKRRGTKRWPFAAGKAEGETVKDTPRLYRDKRFITEDGRAKLIPVTYTSVAETTSPSFPLTLIRTRRSDEWQTLARSCGVRHLMDLRDIAHLWMNPVDARARSLEDEGIVKIESIRGEKLIPLHVTEDIRPGVVYLPVERKGTGLPYRQIGDLKNPAVKVDPYKIAWRGEVILEGNHLTLARDFIKKYEYGVAETLGVEKIITVVDFVSEERLGWNEVASLDEALGIEETPESIVYRDEGGDSYKMVVIEGDAIKGLRFISPNPIDTTALQEKMIGLNTILPDERTTLLSPLGDEEVLEDTKGRIICNCNNVGELEILAAIEGRAKSIADIQAKTRAGTDCGGCIPEIKLILERA